MVIISIVVVISIVVATNVPSDGHTCGYDIMKCLRFERNMFKPKENVIKRKFNGVTMNMEFIFMGVRGPPPNFFGKNKDLFTLFSKSNVLQLAI